MTLDCKISMHPDVAGGVTIARMHVARAQDFHQHVAMTFGQQPSVRAVKSRQGLFVEGYHPTAVGRGNDPDIISHAGETCNR